MTSGRENVMKSKFIYSSYGKYYLSDRFKAIVYINDSNYNSGPLYLKALDSLDFRIMAIFSFKRINDNKAKRILKSLLAERKSELRLISGKNSILAETLTRHIDSLTAITGRFKQTEEKIYNAHLTFRIEDKHPVSLMKGLERFKAIMSLLGFSILAERNHSRKVIGEFSSLAHNPGRNYLVDSHHIAEILPVFFEGIPIKGGILAGLDDDTEKPFFIDIFNRNSFNITIFGETGSGKSFFSKLILRRYGNSGKIDHAIIFDPLDEYFCTLFNNRCVELRINAGEYIDPFEEFTETNDSISVISSMIADFTEEDITGTQIAYHVRDYAKIADAPNMPDLLEFLSKRITESSFQTKILEIKETLFSKKIFIDISEGLPILILKFGNMLGETLQKAMTLSLYNIMLRTRKNPEKKKLILIDEAHLITASTTGRKMLASIVRHSRHFKTSVMNVTQNFSDFTADLQAESIVLNSGSAFIFRTKEEINIRKSLGTHSAALLEPAFLMGGARDPYSECYFINSGTVKRLRVICTENEKIKIDNREDN